MNKLISMPNAFTPTRLKTLGFSMVEMAVCMVLVATLSAFAYAKYNQAPTKANGLMAATTQAAVEQAIIKVTNTLDKPVNGPDGLTFNDLNTALDLVSSSSSGNLVLSVTDVTNKKFVLSAPGFPRLASYQIQPNGSIKALGIDPSLTSQFTITPDATLARIIEIGPTGGRGRRGRAIPDPVPMGGRFPESTAAAWASALPPA
ncbi:MAG: prepilin-type N-terminal cleavage/methylation domain-containing protein [Cyanobacteria bacterium]|nr:prepilin-type N-terminal cleavage/methylation domain-containing protein [Cyanobacteriota bacterium]